ncbi:hypothetical protein ACLOJK_008401 [Asimina triloba]
MSPTKLLPLRFLFILSAISFHNASDSRSPTPPPPQEEKRPGSQWRRKPLRKIPILLFFVVSTATVLRLLQMATNAASSPAPWRPILLQASPPQSPSPPNTFTAKEFRLLSNLISSKTPCNLLIFGFAPQLSVFVEMNAGGHTVFLEDDDEKIRTAPPEIIKDGHIYKIEHGFVESGKAFELLKRAREDPRCAANAGRRLESSVCPLALTRLPKVVLEHAWDVVVIDGPTGENAMAPGRMGVIYSVGLMARGGRATTDVLVHDTDRMVEKWYAWEYLCHENMASSKGKFWHFRIIGNQNSSGFCSTTTVAVE